MSLLATIITSVTFTAYPGAAYAGDWSLLVQGIMFVLVIAGIGMVVVPFFRHVVAMSVYEYFGKRFGAGVRMYASFAFSMGHFSKMGFVFYLLALSVGGITGWGLTKVIVVLGVITRGLQVLAGSEHRPALLYERYCVFEARGETGIGRGTGAATPGAVMASGSVIVFRSRLMFSLHER